MTCSFLTFSYYLFWPFLPNFLRKLWLTHELLWFCRRGTEKLKKQFFFFFFWNNFFSQNISSIHYVEVMNLNFLIWNHIFLLVFENKYIRIGNFVVLAESMDSLLPIGFFIYFVKQFASSISFFLSVIKSVIHCHSQQLFSHNYTFFLLCSCFIKNHFIGVKIICPIT